VARVEGQGALLIGREEVGAQGVSQHIKQVLDVIGAAQENKYY
jgi:hypothetical protein